MFSVMIPNTCYAAPHSNRRASLIWVYREHACAARPFDTLCAWQILGPIQPESVATACCSPHHTSRGAPGPGAEASRRSRGRTCRCPGRPGARPKAAARQRLHRNNIARLGYIISLRYRGMYKQPAVLLLTTQSAAFQQTPAALGRGRLHVDSAAAQLVNPSSEPGCLPRPGHTPLPIRPCAAQ